MKKYQFWGIMAGLMLIASEIKDSAPLGIASIVALVGMVIYVSIDN